MNKTFGLGKKREKRNGSKSESRWNNVRALWIFGSPLLYYNHGGGDGGSGGGGWKCIVLVTLIMKWADRSLGWGKEDWWESFWIWRESFWGEKRKEEEEEEDDRFFLSSFLIPRTLVFLNFSLSLSVSFSLSLRIWHVLINFFNDERLSNDGHERGEEIFTDWENFIGGEGEPLKNSAPFPF